MERTVSNKIKSSVSRKIFNVLNITFLSIFAVLCALPFVNLLAVSLSSSSEVISGNVWFWPEKFTLNAYKYLLGKDDFFVAFGWGLYRVVLGTAISLLVTVLVAYPLSFERDKLRGKNIYIGLILLSMLFSGGLVPTYIVITGLKLRNTIWALVLPTSMNCWNLILVINFFRQVPKDLLDAASIDGCGSYRKLLSIVVPVSMPIIATITLFCIVGQWNSWFDGYLYMDVEKWPLQTYIYNLMDQMKYFESNKGNMTQEEINSLAQTNDATLRSAQIFIAMIPVLCVYPFAQKYFVKGILLGSIKE